MGYVPLHTVFSLLHVIGATTYCIVQLVPSLTLKLAYTPPTTNFWTTYVQHKKLKVGMQAYSNPKT